MELVTVKEYCKIEGITDAGARKRVSQKLAQSVILGDITYIVIPSRVKELKAIIKTKNAMIKQLRTERQIVTSREEQVQKLEDKIERLEAKIESLYEKNTETMEKVIGQYDRLLLPPK